MRKSLVLAAALAALLAPAAAHAQLRAGVRLGWSIPAGEAFEGGELAGFMNGAVPLQLDLGYALGALTVGVYAGRGIGRLDNAISNQCDAVRFECGVGTWRAGGQVTFTLEGLSEAVAPWFGVGFGWERTRFETSNIRNYAGWEVPLQAGADWKALPWLRAGPFLSYSIGQFVADGAGSMGEKALHSYVTFGLRGEVGR